MDTIRKQIISARALTPLVSAFLLRNQGQGQTVAKNTIWLSISNFGGRLLKAVVIIYAARALGPAGWGVASYAITLAGFFTFFADPGINMTLMREGSKADETRRQMLLSTTFIMKLALIAVIVPFVLYVAPFFSVLPGATLLLGAAALIIVGDTLREFFSSFIRAKEKMEREAAVFLLTNLAIVVLGFSFLIAFRSAGAFTWAYAAGTSIGALLGVVLVWPYASSLLKGFSWELVLPIVRSAWPFATIAALGLLLTNTDILILSWFKSASDVGIYSAAIRIIQVLYLMPMIIQYSILPVFSRLARRNDIRLRSLLEHAVALTYALSIPLAFVGVFLGSAIMSFVFGPSYAPGGIALSLLFITMLVDYPGGIIGVAVFAYDRQRQLIIASLIGGLTNVVFDLILIPRFGITGSAVATLIAQTLCNGYLWYAMKQVNDFSILPRLKIMAIAGLSAGAASALLVYAGSPVILTVCLAAALYITLLFTLKEPLIGDIMRIAASGGTPVVSGTKPTVLSIGGIDLSVEVVEGAEAIKQGLAGREALPEGRGMLFLFPEPRQYRFWMAGMRFPLDIIWIDGNTVVDVTHDAPPTYDPDAPVFYSPKTPARSVLEVNAGFCARHGIAPGALLVLHPATL